MQQLQKPTQQLEKSILAVSWITKRVTVGWAIQNCWQLQEQSMTWSLGSKLQVDGLSVDFKGLTQCLQHNCNNVL